MDLVDDVQRNLQALLDEGKTVSSTLKNEGGGSRYADVAMAQRWATQAEALLASVFGADSSFVRELQRFSEQSGTWHEDQVKQIWGVIAGAVDSWREGYVFNIRAEAEAEVEGSLLGDAARDLARSNGVNEPDRRAAAVLAGSVLERHLRGLYKKHGGSKDPEKVMIEDLGIELRKLGVIDEVKRKRISSIAASRNAAAHSASFTESAEDVKRMIETVTDLCDQLR